jgi:hypothetical protein
VQNQESDRRSRVCSLRSLLVFFFTVFVVEHSAFLSCMICLALLLCLSLTTSTPRFDPNCAACMGGYCDPGRVVPAKKHVRSAAASPEITHHVTARTVFSEDWGFPTIDYSAFCAPGNWLYDNSDLRNYYVPNNGSPCTDAGNNVMGLWPDKDVITFAPAVSSSITQITFDYCPCSAGTMTVYDTSNTLISTTNAPYACPIGIEVCTTITVASTTGISSLQSVVGCKFIERIEEREHEKDNTLTDPVRSQKSEKFVSCFPLRPMLKDTTLRDQKFNKRLILPRWLCLSFSRTFRSVGLLPALAAQLSFQASQSQSLITINLLQPPSRNN